MSKVVLQLSMSLDGFVAGPRVSHEHGMGVGGERLHDWMFTREARQTEMPESNVDDVDGAVIQEVFATTGAVVLGRRTFDVGLQHWNDTPYPVPSFVLTHRPHARLEMTSSTFTFVTDGIERALAQAKAAAGDKNVMLMGGDVAQQVLKAGLIDEIQINLVPVLLGEGLRLFEHFGNKCIELECTRVVESRVVTHLTYRVVK